MTKKNTLRQYEVTFAIQDTTQTIKIEGASISAYSLSDGSESSCFAVYGEDGKTPVLMIAWESFVLARLAQVVEVLTVRRSRKVIDLEASNGDSESETDS